MVKCDLHMHSCLSPCGDDSMNPFDMVGMAALNGLDLVALTDHNSAKNCPAAAVAAEFYGIGFIPGVEVATSEDIHVVCLFSSLEWAMRFDDELSSHLPDVKNRPEIFGRQIIYGADGEISGEEERLLIAGCDLSVLELPEMVRRFGGLCYPAHVDRESNGLLAILGAWPRELLCTAAEIRDSVPPGLPVGLRIIKASDAHRLEDMPADGFELELKSADYNGLAEYMGW